MYLRTVNVKSALAKMTPMQRAEFAVQIKVSERTVYRWATGKSKIDPLKLPAIEAALKAR